MTADNPRLFVLFLFWSHFHFPGEFSSLNWCLQEAGQPLSMFYLHQNVFCFLSIQVLPFTRLLLYVNRALMRRLRFSQKAESGHVVICCFSICLAIFFSPHHWDFHEGLNPPETFCPSFVPKFQGKATDLKRPAFTPVFLKGTTASNFNTRQLNWWHQRSRLQ